MSQQDSLFQEPAPVTSQGRTPFSNSALHQDDLTAQWKTVQRNLSNVLILLLVVSGTFSIYLLQEVRYDRANLAGMNVQDQQLQQARQVIANYNQHTVPTVTQFLHQLTDYARAHPDVMPILLKYGLVQRGNPQAEGPPAQQP